MKRTNSAQFYHCSKPKQNSCHSAFSIVSDGFSHSAVTDSPTASRLNVTSRENIQDHTWELEMTLSTIRRCSSATVLQDFAHQNEIKELYSSAELRESKQKNTYMFSEPLADDHIVWFENFGSRDKKVKREEQGCKSDCEGARTKTSCKKKAKSRDYSFNHSCWLRTLNEKDVNLVKVTMSGVIQIRRFFSRNIYLIPPIPFIFK